MADVRLTATNPEDSSVVPVACDASGRLLLEEQGQGPPGPPGPKGDDGDPFNGNFADDVTFGGSAKFAGSVNSDGLFFSGTPTTSRGLFQANVPSDKVGNAANTNEAFRVVRYNPLTSAQESTNVAIYSDGSAEFKGRVKVEDVTGVSSFYASSAKDAGKAHFTGTIIGDPSADNYLFLGQVAGGNDNGVKFSVASDGSATFAGNKAGFTKEGYLWCTTRRGDTVILDATSNGLASWVEYTPTTRKDEIRDKLDAIRPDTGEMPADTQ